MVEIPSSKVI